MLISWNLLKQLIDIPVSPETAAERLTMAGAEVEYIAYPAGKLKGVTVVRVKELKQHPSKDSLLLAYLDTGSGEAICVTAAKNLNQGDRVFYAPPGAVLADGTVITQKDFSGAASAGMVLSGAELGMPEIDAGTGILILPADAPIGADALSLYGIDDTVMDISVTPNRGDLLSIVGLARELKGLFPEAVLKSPFSDVKAGEKPWPAEFEFKGVSLPDPGCLCYNLGLVTGIKVGPSPFDVRVSLVRMGMRPISNVVDATNYAMLMLGQPLHAFDLNTFPAREITVRAAADGEKIITLDEKERILTSKDMLITSGGEPVGLAGVMGGGKSGISDDTHTVVLESASFSPLRVGHTSRRLGLHTEAAARYARIVDPNLSAFAADYTLSLIGAWSSGDAGYSKISAVNSLPRQERVKLTKKKLHTYLLWSDMDKAAEILEGFGIKQIDCSGEVRTFEVPTARPDITIEEDLIEEIGRFIGYNDSPADLPGEMPCRGEVGTATFLSGVVRSVLMARGYTEAVTYSFLPESFPTGILLPEDDLRARPLTLANPISQDQIAMRTTLLPGLISGLKASTASGWRGAIRLFEQGRVFLRTEANSSEHTEHETVAGLVFNGSDPRTPWKDQLEDFLSVKADVMAILELRGLAPRFTVGNEPFGHSGQTAFIQLEVSGKWVTIGYLARLKPVLEQSFDIQGAVYVFEMNLSYLETVRAPLLKPSAAFPASLRDISMVVPKNISQESLAAEIREAADEVGEKLLESVKLFDIYEGSNIPDGFRSLAFSLAYRSSERTLNDEEVEKIHCHVRDSMTKKGYNTRGIKA